MNESVNEPTFEALVARARGLAAPGRRAVLGIVGSPGSGKSTLAEALLDALRADPPPGAGPDWVAHVPMDGYHLADVELERLGLRHAKGAVVFDDVEFAYSADTVVLPEFDLDVPAGQTIALVGSTGAGKSTLAKLMSRFYDPTRGRVTLDGVDLRDLHPKDLRRAIVMVTQEA